MTPAEQEQRVLCEVLQGLGYDVGIQQINASMVACWLTSGWRGDWVWWPGAGSVPQRPWAPEGCNYGPVCRTPEEVIAWVVANVPRPVVV